MVNIIQSGVFFQILVDGLNVQLRNRAGFSGYNHLLLWLVSRYHVQSHITNNTITD